MAAQLTLDLKDENNKPIKIQTAPIRIRYEVPTYFKFYSFYQYDRDKFRQLLNEWLKTDEGKNRTFESLRAKQDEILEQCYIRDKYGNKLRDSDSKHIYRLVTLHTIQEKIYDYVIMYYMQNGIQKIKGLNVYSDEKQAELQGTWDLPIKKRVMIHIKLLRLLRKGFNIKEAVCKIKNKRTLSPSV